jgi:hypothetical protein
MNALLRSEVFLVLLALGLFTLAALYFSGDFNAWQEARDFYNSGA